ncbi:MAG: 16S rRNA (cytosine(1402)-N(4))-methyltransferase RsmH [Oscillospiraceae bacterium]|nr:16S rRNA (cytosine(1402)-N(4))-methyltransferase RsmH [Oscillospiraceae bacterium]
MFSHRPVLLNEVIAGLAIKPEGIYIDGTAGGAGHSIEIAKRLTTGRLIAIDQDPDAVKAAGERLSPFPNAQVVHSRYSKLPQVLDDLGIALVDGVLLDIGVSSHQLDTAERGFSFHSESILDMRMSQNGPTAADLVNTKPHGELTRILRDYGEEPFAFKIAAAICKAREEAPITSTLQLAEIIKWAVPAKARRDGHPARKSFQAIRISLNMELEELENGLVGAFERLKAGGRLAVITFHSLESRICKRQMAEWCKGCDCPPEFPVCVCNKKPQAKLITRKPIEPSPMELEENPRSRSSLLRVCEKI